MNKCSFSELHRCPSVLLTMVDKVQSVTFGFFADDGNVIYVETAHQQFRSGIHAGYVVLHICQEDIAVDVG